MEIIELYSYAPEESLLMAFAAVVLQMQPPCRQFAYHAIAHVMDWSNRSEIWHAAELEGEGEFSWLCAGEPGGKERVAA